MNCSFNYHFHPWKLTENYPFTSLFFFQTSTSSTWSPWGSAAPSSAAWSPCWCTRTASATSSSRTTPPSSTPSRPPRSTPASPTTSTSWTSTTRWKPSRSVGRFAPGGFHWGSRLTGRVEQHFVTCTYWLNLWMSHFESVPFLLQCRQWLNTPIYCMTLTVTPPPVVHWRSPVV